MLSINAKVSWKPASFLLSPDLPSSSTPPEVHRGWIMTLLFRARLSSSKTLHHFGTQRQIQYACRATGTVSFTSTQVRLRLQPHTDQQHTFKVRTGSVRRDVGHGEDS